MASSVTLEGGSLSFSMLLLSLSLYFIIEKFFRNLFRSKHPAFYDNLAKERKDIPYFAFIMGIVLNVVATPACSKALWDSSNQDDLSNGISSAGQMCLASKGVLWVSELNRLDHSNIYIIHHLSSISYLVYHIQVGLPLRILYAFYVSLATEIFSNTACIAAYHNLKATTSPLVYRIQAINTLLLVCLRIPPMIYASTFLTANPISSPIFWINTGSLFVYARFIINNIIGAATRLQLVQCILQRPARIRVAQRFDISIYGLFFATSSFFTAILAAYIYLHDAQVHVSIPQLYTQLLITGFTSLFGARVPAILATGKPRDLLSSKVFAPNGLWIQGALLMGTLSILLSPITDRSRLLLSLIVALPLGEAIGRVGCHFAGCCAVPNPGRSLTTQLQATLLNFLAATTTITLYMTAHVSLVNAGGLALIINALIRLFLRPNLFAFCQSMAGIILLAANLDRRFDTSTAVLSENVVLGNLNERLFWSPWIAVLAMAAFSAGGFVQGCASGIGNLKLIQGCDNANLGIAQGCRKESLEAIQGCSGAESLGISQGCASGRAAQLALVQDYASGKEAETDPVQGCRSEGSARLTVAQGCSHDGEAALREVNQPSRLI